MNPVANTTKQTIVKNKTFKKKAFEFWTKYKYLHILALPCVLYFIVFKYLPMYGIIIAFKDYSGSGGFWGIIDSEWVGLLQFRRFFNSVYFYRLTRNTLLISGYRLIFGFPMPILLALLLNEIRNIHFKKTVQTITYMPHFLSWVVVAGLVTTFLSPTSGPLNILLKQFGIEPIYFLGEKKYFRSILVISSIWKEIGWSSIIYLAAIAGIDPTLYEAATMDGARKWQKIWHITLPSIKEIIVIFLILAVGRILDENFEQILNLYNELVYEVADVYETYVYRQGLVEGLFAYSAAVNLFKAVISLIMVYGTNKIAKRIGAEGLW